MITDAHVHFFSPGFYRALAASRPAVSGDPATADPAMSIPHELGWTAAPSAESLADTWVAELDRHGVSLATLIASMPGDETSVASAVTRHPDRFYGAFMFNPGAPDAAARLDATFSVRGMRMVCLFPAMHKVAVDDGRTVAVFEAAERHQRAVFVHCGILSVGIRKKLGLPSPFDIRLGDPLAVAAVAVQFPSVPVVIPHFGAGFFREALMAAAMAPNVVFDTSSSNGWVGLQPGLTLRDVFERALHVAGPQRLIFGTDSSFFPRGWQRGVYDTQREVLEDLGLDQSGQSQIFSGNLRRIVGHGQV